MNKLKTVAATTLGCKVNFYDTEAMLELFKKSGYEVVDFKDHADIYIINTCTITNLGDRKSRQIIRRAKTTNPDAIVAAVGCYAQVAPEEVSKIDGINLVLGTKDRSKIVELIERNDFQTGTVNVVSNIMEEVKFEPLSVQGLQGRQRAYLKIQEGCEQYCTYCIIPYARGKVRSRQEKDVLAEVKQLSQNGYKEIIFSGIHVASYGKDLGDTNLLQMIQKTHEVDGIERLRLSSIEPTTMSEEFVTALKKLPKICPHFHLSLQSGCDKTLKRMNRKYTAEQYRQAVERIRNAYPNASITTDIIVGFPDETDEDFQESLRFVEEMKLSDIHVFPYSPKKGTPAAAFKNQVPTDVKNKRAAEFLALAKRLSEQFSERFVGQQLSVLFETEVSDGVYEGLSDNYLTVQTKNEKNLIKQIISVTIEKEENSVLYGIVR